MIQVHQFVVYGTCVIIPEVVINPSKLAEKIKLNYFECLNIFYFSNHLTKEDDLY